MTIIDWAVVAVFLLLILAIGFLSARFGGKSTENFIVGGRSLHRRRSQSPVVARGGQQCRD